MIPTLSLPPAMPSTAQLRFEAAIPQDWPWNDCCDETSTVADAGEIANPGVAATVTLVFAVALELAWLTAPMVCWPGAAGAV